MTTSTATFAVTGMSCSHCENAIRAEVGSVPGVTDVDVSATTGDLTVSGPGPIDPAAVLAAVDEAGYSAVQR